MDNGRKLNPPNRNRSQNLCDIECMKKLDVFPSSSTVWLKAMSKQLAEDDLAVTGNIFNIIVFSNFYSVHSFKCCSILSFSDVFQCLSMLWSDFKVPLRCFFRLWLHVIKIMQYDNWNRLHAECKYSYVGNLDMSQGMWGLIWSSCDCEMVRLCNLHFQSREFSYSSTLFPNLIFVKVRGCF